MHMTMTDKTAFSSRDNARMVPSGSADADSGETGMKHDALFERFSARLKAKVGPDVYASWFGRLKIHPTIGLAACYRFR